MDSKVVSAWNTVPERIREVAARFKLVHIDCRNAVELLLQLDGPRSVFYVDPPYVMDTINFRKKVIYQDAFSDRQHLDLLGALHNIEGKALVSGYRCELYDDMLKDWHRVDVDHRCMSGNTKVESLWMNYDPPAKALLLPAA